MPHTENTECSLISPIQTAWVAQPTGNRWAETELLLMSGRNRYSRLEEYSKTRRTGFAVLCIPALKNGVFRARPDKTAEAPIPVFLMSSSSF